MGTYALHTTYFPDGWMCGYVDVFSYQSVSQHTEREELSLGSPQLPVCLHPYIHTDAIPT